MGQLVAGLEEAFDVVVIDAPPLLPVTDAAVLSQHVGGVMVVVGSQRLRQQELQRALDALQLVEANVLGIVMNRLPAKGPDAYSYSYYAGDEHPNKDRSVSSRRTRQAAPTGESQSLQEPSRRSASTFPVGRSR